MLSCRISVRDDFLPFPQRPAELTTCRIESNGVFSIDLDESAEELQHLINIDCALALSVCK